MFQVIIPLEIPRISAASPQMNHQQRTDPMLVDDAFATSPYLQFFGISIKERHFGKCGQKGAFSEPYHKCLDFVVNKPLSPTNLHEVLYKKKLSSKKKEYVENCLGGSSQLVYR